MNGNHLRYPGLWDEIELLGQPRGLVLPRRPARLASRAWWLVWAIAVGDVVLAVNLLLGVL